MRFPYKITSSCIWPGLPYLLIELLYIGVPVMRTDVRSLDYHNLSDGWATFQAKY